MRRACACLPLLLAVAALPRPAVADEKAVGLAALSSAFTAAEYRKVVDLAAAFPAEHADAPKAHYLAGEARLVLGEPAEAEGEFRAVLAKKPKAQPALVGLGRSLSALAKHEEAVTTLRSAAAADAKDTAALRALGEALLLAGKAEEGTRTLEQAAKAAPNDPQTVRALVEARLRAADFPGAQALGEKLAKALPKHPMGDFLTALALDRQGKAADAIAAYERALAKDDRFLDAHKDLAILCHVQSNTYQDAARVKKAFEHYERYFALGGADERLKQMYATLQSFFDAAKK